jgi:hypothetical protein
MQSQAPLAPYVGLWGRWQGTWQTRDRTLRIQPFTRLRRTDRDALLAEAAQLSAFVAPAGHDIVLDEPQAGASREWAWPS